MHCTASWQDTTTKESLLAEFKRNGWKKPGYHYVVKPDGNIIIMLDEAEVANGVKGYNANSIHVAWIGGLAKKDGKTINKDNRTGEQKTALFDLLTKLKQKYPNIKLILVLPCKSQTRGWRQSDIDEYERIMKQADKVVYTSEDYYNGCMQKRNRHLVDGSSLCIAYLTKETGGSAYTVKYAEKNALTVINIAEK